MADGNQQAIRRRVVSSAVLCRGLQKVTHGETLAMTKPTEDQIRERAHELERDLQEKSDGGGTTIVPG
jgi:hypothetical protein